MTVVVIGRGVDSVLLNRAVETQPFEPIGDAA
ncbi:UNVERIFIED_ORG: hypothetical protein J2791_003312 [Burkholderia contaminans]|nr:hypothetical protein [Burkholderia contaminans]